MKILLPIDGSAFAKAAVDFVASRATLIGTAPQVEVLNVQPPIPGRAARALGKSLVSSYHAAEASRVLKPAAATLRKEGIEASTRFVVGLASEEIAAAADRDRVDLIVMGSHGHSALAGLALGSCAAGVLARTQTPVVLLRSKSRPMGDALSVGIAVDGSRYGKAAARYVARHRALFGAAARFTLINVVADFAGATMPDMAGLAMPALSDAEVHSLRAQAFERAVAPVRRMMAREKLACDEVCLAGLPGDEIAAYAKKTRLDLVVLGSHGWGAFKRLILGSVATRVAARCATPLLLIRRA